MKRRKAQKKTGRVVPQHTANELSELVAKMCGQVDLVKRVDDLRAKVLNLQSENEELRKRLGETEHTIKTMRDAARYLGNHLWLMKEAK